MTKKKKAMKSIVVPGMQTGWVITGTREEINDVLRKHDLKKEFNDAVKAGALEYLKEKVKDVAKKISE
jgi:hypothetical protein